MTDNARNPGKNPGMGSQDAVIRVIRKDKIIKQSGRNAI